MNSFQAQLGVQLRLHFRNRMAMLYGYLFPTIFLVAFAVLYRHESVPLVRHMGELLTVTALGGACFGLPTSLVAERERGVWRRYRLSPAPTGSLLAATVLARYLLLLVAALLQIALAMAIGMPFPEHPFDLWVAFTLVAFAFLGLGLVIAALADNVPAVQALGQCIFLPMLIIGGVAVRLESLPEWAQHLSAFFPGRYAVQAIQSSVNGDGLGAGAFSLLALLLIGAACCLTGGKMFRWDAQQRATTRGDRGWVAVALASWLAVGAMAEARGMTGGIRRASLEAPPTREPVSAAAARADTLPARAAAGTPAGGPASVAAPADPAPAPAADSVRPAPPGSAPAPSAATAPAPLPGGGAWQAVTMADLAEISFERLPPDDGVVAPIAPASESPFPSVAKDLQCVRAALPAWPPGRVADPVQRVRNLLYVAAVPDMFQMEELEPWLPRVVFERLQQDIPREQLIKILYWIAMHPEEGDDFATTQLRRVCLDTGAPSDTETLQERTSMYAVKLLGRLTGRIQPG